MFTFTSPAITKNVWNLCFRTRAEMNRLYYEDRPIDPEVRIFGITTPMTSTIYLDEELDGFLLAKTLRHELTHIYLWETGQQGRVFNEEEMCDIMSVAAPAVNQTTSDIMLRLKEGWYKHGE
jgi:predicted SprT family Zn-dependent metalloprotease